VEGKVKPKVAQHPNNFPPFATTEIEMFLFAKSKTDLIVILTGI
jgi:hypothetical protein